MKLQALPTFRTSHLVSLAPIGVLGFLGLSACSGGDDSTPAPAPVSAATSTFDATVAVQWNEELYRAVKTTSVNPPRAARIWAYTGVTLYEAVVHGMPAHRTLQGQIAALPADTLPAPTPGLVYDWAIGANRALSAVSTGLITGGTAATDFAAREAALLDSLDDTVPQAVIDRSVAYGDALAAAILAWAATDGTDVQADCQTNWIPPVDPVDGGWTSLNVPATQPLLPCWGDMRTFVVADGEECAPIGPPAFSTSTSSAWYAQALLVYNMTGDAGANLTADQAALALYWADNAAATGTPGGHWIAITCQVAGEQTQRLDVAAEAFARVGLAIADAFITCWKEKYQSYLMRPATYIQANIDPAWSTLIGTPNFPTYTSGHSTQSGAAATVLSQMLGVYPFTDSCHSRLNPELGFTDRTFPGFIQAASEAATSRMYGGIHYLFDNYDGFDSGVCVGSIHNSTLQFLADN